MKRKRRTRRARKSKRLRAWFNQPRKLSLINRPMKYRKRVNKKLKSSKPNLIPKASKRAKLMSKRRSPNPSLMRKRKNQQRKKLRPPKN